MNYTCSMWLNNNNTRSNTATGLKTPNINHYEYYLWNDPLAAGWLSHRAPSACWLVPYLQPCSGSVLCSGYESIPHTVSAFPPGPRLFALWDVAQTRTDTGIHIWLFRCWMAKFLKILHVEDRLAKHFLHYFHQMSS